MTTKIKKKKKTIRKKRNKVKAKIRRKRRMLNKNESIFL
jgi:hypothetical protein